MSFEDYSYANHNQHILVDRKGAIRNRGHRGGRQSSLNNFQSESSGLTQRMVTAGVHPERYRHASLTAETESEANKRLERQEESQAKDAAVIPGADGRNSPAPQGEEGEATESSDESGADYQVFYRQEEIDETHRQQNKDMFKRINQKR